MGWNWDFMERYIFLALLPVCLGFIKIVSYICKGKNWSHGCLHGLVFGDKKTPWLFLTDILYKLRYCKDFVFKMDVVNFDLPEAFLSGRTWVGVRTRGLSHGLSSEKTGIVVLLLPVFSLVPNNLAQGSHSVSLFSLLKLRRNWYSILWTWLF